MLLAIFGKYIVTALDKREPQSSKVRQSRAYSIKNNISTKTLSINWLQFAISNKRLCVLGC